MKFNKSSEQDNDVNRREFMSTVTKAVGSAMFLTAPSQTWSQPDPSSQSWTVGQIMDLFISEVPGAPFGQTVDTLKAGDRDIRVTGIVTTMFATLEVIQKAIELNANFIIAHEPTYYNHLDDTSWLQDDPVYRHKAALLKKHNMAVWRNHDYIHRLSSDGVRDGVVARLGWRAFATGKDASVFEIPSMTLRSLTDHVKTKLGIPTVRYIGDLSESARRILLMPGASGGRSQITAIIRAKPDVIICGEISEWETAEYVRDARTKGDGLSLVVLGHVASEEPGSEFLADWLNRKVNGLRSTHIPAGNSLMFA